MILRNRLIYCLLIFFIGLLPVANPGAGDMDQRAEMSAGCVNCDPGDLVDHHPCDGENCLAAYGACGASSGVTIICTSALNPGLANAAVGDRGTPEFRFRSYLSFAIYRPPIV